MFSKIHPGLAFFFLASALEVIDNSREALMHRFEETPHTQPTPEGIS